MRSRGRVAHAAGGGPGSNPGSGGVTAQVSKKLAGSKQSVLAPQGKQHLHLYISSTFQASLIRKKKLSVLIKCKE